MIPVARHPFAAGPRGYQPRMTRFNLLGRLVNRIRQLRALAKPGGTERQEPR